MTRALIFEDQKKTKPKPQADAEIKRFLSFSFSNLFTIFVFATRTAIKVADDLTVIYEIDEPTISQMVREIYKNLAKERITGNTGVPCGVTTQVEGLNVSALSLSPLTIVDSW